MKLIPHNNAVNGSHRGSMVPLRDAVSHLFEEALWDPFSFATRVPLVDVFETQKEFIIEADAPGYSEKDVELEVDGNTLVLRAQKEISTEEKEDKTYHLQERRQSYWERRFSIPAHVEAAEITCTMKDGQLRIRLPKMEKETSRKIKIEMA